MNVRYLTLLTVALFIASCAIAQKQMSVDEVLNGKVGLEYKEIYITGLLLQKKDGFYICSKDRPEEQCLNLEYALALKQLISDNSGRVVLLYGTYIPHEFQDDGLTFLPSRIRVSKLDGLPTKAQ